MAGCSREWFERVSAWHDGEVTAHAAARVEAHLDGCAACRAAAGSLARMRAVLVRRANPEIPPRLRARAMTAAKRRQMRQRVVAFATIAAAAAVAVAVWPSRLEPKMAEEVVAHHLGGFARERPCDFESGNADAVSQWVEGRLGYHVAVPTPPGAELLGARVCSLQGEKTAALMYRTGGAPLTIFVPRAQSVAAQATASFAGEHVRCTGGALSNQICATVAEQPMLAVADTDRGALAAILANPSPR